MRSRVMLLVIGPDLVVRVIRPITSSRRNVPSIMPGKVLLYLPVLVLRSLAAAAMPMLNLLGMRSLFARRNLRDLAGGTAGELRIVLFIVLVATTAPISTIPPPIAAHTPADRVHRPRHLFQKCGQELPALLVVSSIFQVFVECGKTLRLFMYHRDQIVGEIVDWKASFS